MKLCCASAKAYPTYFIKNIPYFHFAHDSLCMWLCNWPLILTGNSLYGSVCPTWHVVCVCVCSERQVHGGRLGDVRHAHGPGGVLQTEGPGGAVRELGASQTGRLSLIYNMFLYRCVFMCLCFFLPTFCLFIFPLFTLPGQFEKKLWQTFVKILSVIIIKL